MDGETAFFATETISVWGDQVVKIAETEVVEEIIAKLARQVGAVKTRGAAKNIIRGGGTYNGLKNENICDGMATVLLFAGGERKVYG